MRRLLLAVVLAATLLLGGLPAMGHTTHSHTCNTSHGWVYESSTWRHNSVVTYQADPDRHWSAQAHWQWLAGDGLNKWVWRHNTSSGICLD